MKDEYAKDEYTDEKDYLDDGEEEDDEESEFEQEEREKDKRHGNPKLLTAIQVIGSLIVLAAAVALRFSGSGDYEKVRAWYFSAVNDSLITEEQSSTVKHTVVGLWNHVAGAGTASSSTESSQSSVSSPAESRSVSGKTAL